MLMGQSIAKTQRHLAILKSLIPVYFCLYILLIENSNKTIKSDYVRSHVCINVYIKTCVRVHIPVSLYRYISLFTERYINTDL